MTAAPETSDSRPQAPDARALPLPEHVRRMVARAAHAMLLVTRDGRIVDANPRAAALLDRAKGGVVGLRLVEMLAPSDGEPVAHALRACAQGGETPPDLEARLNHGFERQSLVALTFLPLDGHVALLLRDLTRERATRDAAAEKEALAVRAEAVEHRKMADLGRLISGVAHELRTPLTFVTNTLELERARLHQLAEERPDVAPLVRDVLAQHDAIQDSVARVNRLVRDLRPLTKNRPHRTVMMDLAQLVTEAVHLFRGAHQGRTRVELDLEATHLIPLDREDMQAVVVNLLMNAADAMGGEGVVRVQTRNRETPPEIRVIDTGPGVPPHFREALFEPFRTTKADGTGLGLFISRRTVEAHGGTLTYEATRGGGATFVVRLPMPSDAA